MRAIPALLITALLMISPAVYAFSEFYTWTDDDGVVHFSETPPDTAEESLEYKELDTFKQTAEPPPVIAPKTQEPVKRVKKPTKKEAMEKAVRVDLYTTDWCPGCKRAKKALFWLLREYSERIRADSTWYQRCNFQPRLNLSQMASP